MTFTNYGLRSDRTYQIFSNEMFFEYFNLPRAPTNYAPRRQSSGEFPKNLGIWGGFLGEASADKPEHDVLELLMYFLALNSENSR